MGKRHGSRHRNSDERKAFLEAKQTILDAANDHRKAGFIRARGGMIIAGIPKYRMRHINQAVCVVRRNDLIDEEILKTAGFNAKG